MPPVQEDLQDHDRLIRVDQKTIDMDEKLDWLLGHFDEFCDTHNKLKARVLRLEVIISVIASGGTVAAGALKGFGVW